MLPEGYTAELGGRVLDDGFVVASQIDYEILEPFKDYRVKLPTLKRYRVGPILPGQELRIQDEQGREVPQEQNEADYLPKCSEADRKRLEEFALDFLNAYLPYAGDLNRAGYAYWDTLYYMIVHGGTLEDRLIQARSGFGYGNTYSVEILSDDVRLAADLGNDYYLIDIGYRTETVGLHGPVQEDNQARLLIVEQEGDAYYGQERQLYVEAMFNY